MIAPGAKTQGATATIGRVVRLYLAGPRAEMGPIRYLGHLRCRIPSRREPSRSSEVVPRFEQQTLRRARTTFNLGAWRPQVNSARGWAARSRSADVPGSDLPDGAVGEQNQATHGFAVQAVQRQRYLADFSCPDRSRVRCSGVSLGRPKSSSKRNVVPTSGVETSMISQSVIPTRRCL